MSKAYIRNMPIMENPYEELANAVIIQAAYDYCAMLEQRRYYIRNSWFMREMQELEAFFLSEQFQMLTAVSGAYLLGRMQTEFEHGWRGNCL